MSERVDQDSFDWKKIGENPAVWMGKLWERSHQEKGKQDQG